MITVLYVDDEPALLEIGKLFLEKIGNFSVDTCSSAPEALKLLEHTSFNAVLSDYDMPVMNGIQFLKEVRMQYPNLPFVIFTGRGREEVVIEALNNGVDFYLQKGGDIKSQFAELSHKLRMAVGHRESQSRIRHLARLYSILSKTNEAIVYIRNRNDLLAEACRIAVIEGGFPMTWVGLYEPESGRIEPVAHSSRALDSSRAPAEPGIDLPLEAMPTAITLREDRYYISADNRTDPAVAPWRDALLLHGFKSSAAFPIRIGEQVIGAMTFHAAEPGFFSEDEVQLLVELTEDLSFALEMMDQDHQHKAIEHQLEITQFAIDRAVDAAYLVDAEGHFLYVNWQTVTILGYPCDEILSLKVTDIDRRFFDSPVSSWKDYVQEIRETKAMIFVTEHRTKNGLFIPLQITAHHLEFAEKEYIWVFARTLAPEKNH
ncbi:MAG: response regulator [Methanomicrobiales archaeon]